MNDEGNLTDLDSDDTLSDIIQPNTWVHEALGQYEMSVAEALNIPMFSTAGLVLERSSRVSRSTDIRCMLHVAFRFSLSLDRLGG